MRKQRNFWARTVITMLALFITGAIIPGIEINEIVPGFFAAIVFGFVNGFLKPILTLLTLPFTILTFGLFLLVINGLMLMLTSALVPGFIVENLLAAIFGSIILSITNSLLNEILQ